MKTKNIILLIIITLFLVVNSIFTYAALSNSLWAYYAFENNALDSTSNDYDGTNNGGTYNASGIKGISLNCDGVNDYMEVIPSYTIPLNRNYTMTIWFKYDKFSGTAPTNANVIFTYYDIATGTGLDVGRMDTLGKIESAMHDGATGNYWTNADQTQITAPVRLYQWQFYTLTHNSLTTVNNVYINGVLNLTFNSGTRTDIDRLTFCAYTTSAGSYGAVSIDEAGIWNRTLSTTEITQLYNSGNGLSYSDIVADGSGDTTPPKLTFIDQYPTPITIFNNVGRGLNITYNITDNVDVNLSTTAKYLNFSLNISGQPLNQYLNGSPVLGFNRNAPYINKTSNYTFSVFDNQLFYALYNYNESLMESSTHFRKDCGLSTCQYIGEFYNFSNTNPFNIFELDIRKDTLNPFAVEVGLCNERVTTVTTSPNCTQIFSNTNLPVNHSHAGGISNHSVVSFTFNTTNNKVNELWINNTIYPYVITNNNPTFRWNLGYITAKSRTNAYMYYNTTLGAYQDLDLSFDWHIHQNASILNYQACAYDTSNNFNCSEMRKVSISQDTNMQPDAPTFINPNETTTFYNPIGNLTYIDYIIGISPSGNTLSYCKIDLLDNNLLYSRNINSSIPYPISDTYFLNSVNITNYFLNLTCCDTTGLCSNTISNEFSIYYYDLPTPQQNNTGNVVVTVNTDLTGVVNSFQMLVFVFFMIMVCVVIFVLSKLSPFFLALYVYPLFEIMVYLAYYDNFAEFKRVSLIGSALCISGMVLLTIVALIYKFVGDEKENKRKKKSKSFYGRNSIYDDNDF